MIYFCEHSASTTPFFVFIYNIPAAYTDIIIIGAHFYIVHVVSMPNEKW